MAEFPLPRIRLPKIDVTPESHAAHRNMMERMLLHTMGEFEQFTYVDNGTVDSKIWRPLATKDQLKVFKERQTGAMSASLAFALDNSSSAALSAGSIIAALTPASMLMTGYCPGRMENAMSAVVTKTQEEQAMVMTYLYDDVADCAILNTMDGPTDEDPYKYLGYKYLVRKASGAGFGTQLVKHRDSLYLEYTGITRSNMGDEIGFHLMHSIDLPEFPDLTDMNSVRAVSSLRYLYRQKTENIVEIFMLGNIDLSGMILKPISTVMIPETMFSCTRLIACGEAKRLTHMVMKRRRIAMSQSSRSKSSSNECGICRRKKTLFSTISHSECCACGQFVCARCRSEKRVFVSDGILGKLEKVSPCKSCVLVANTGYEQPRVHVTLSRHLLDKKSNVNTNGSVRSGSSSNGSGRRRAMTSSRGSNASFMMMRSEKSYSDASSIGSSYTAGGSYHAGSSYNDSWQSSSEEIGRHPAPPTVTSSDVSTISIARHRQISLSAAPSVSSSSHGTEDTVRTRVDRVPSIDELEQYHQEQMQQQRLPLMRQRKKSIDSIDVSQPIHPNDLIPLMNKELALIKQNDLIPLDRQVSGRNQRAPSRSAHSPYDNYPRTMLLPTSQPATTVSQLGNSHQSPASSTALTFHNRANSKSTSHGQSSPLTSKALSISSARSYSSSTTSSSSTGSGRQYSSKQEEMWARMMHISKVAESTYNTTQQNAMYLERQRQYSVAKQRR